jgi:hypothetical protein
MEEAAEEEHDQVFLRKEGFASGCLRDSEA